MEDKEQNQYVDRVSAARGQSVRCVTGAELPAGLMLCLRKAGSDYGRI